MTAKFTLESLNNRPLNREAVKHLLAAQQDPDPSLQAMYQLLLWGLEEGGLKWPHRQGLEEPYQLFLERVAVCDNGPHRRPARRHCGSRLSYPIPR